MGRQAAWAGAGKVAPVPASSDLAADARWAALVAVVACPACAAALRLEEQAAVCAGCGATYAFSGDTLDLAGTAGAPAERERYRQPPPALPPMPARRLVLRQYVRGHTLRRCLMHAELASRPPLSGTVLDLGAGEDPTYRGLLPLAEGAQVLTVDLFPGPEVAVTADFARSLPLRSGSVEAVLALNLLEHLYQPQVLLRETARVLRPGGALLLYVPFLSLLHGWPLDYFRYTEHALGRMLEEAGFAEVSISPHGGVASLLQSVWDSAAKAALPLRLALLPGTWLALSLDSLAERLTRSRLRRRAVLGYFVEARTAPGG